MLLHREAGKVRFMLRDGITVKIAGNFYVALGVPYCQLTPTSGSETGWRWLAFDCLDGAAGAAEWLALKLASREFVGNFKGAIPKAKVPNCR